MRRFFKLTTIAAALCAIALCQVDSQKVDPRMLGTWKLNAGKSVFDNYSAGSKDAVMTIQKDGDHVVVRTSQNVLGVAAKGPNGTQIWHWALSLNGATVTQTASGWEPKTGKPYRATLVWDRQ
jgi:hypothetical protein